jgi:hypothetical protein
MMGPDDVVTWALILMTVGLVSLAVAGLWQ